MVSSVSSTIPYSYYNILNPQAPLTVPTGLADASSASSTDNSSGSSSSGNLSGGSGVQLSSDVIGLLQQLLGGGSSTDPLDSLLGSSSSSSSDTLASLLGTSQLSGQNLLSGTPEGQILSQAYASALSAAVSGTTLAVADQSANGNSTLQSALSAYQAAFNVGHPNPVVPGSTTS